MDTGPSLAFLLEILVVALCCGDPSVLDLQDWPLRLLQQIVGGINVEVGQLNNPVSGLE